MKRAYLPFQRCVNNNSCLMVPPQRAPGLLSPAEFPQHTFEGGREQCFCDLHFANEKKKMKLGDGMIC